MSNNSIRSIVIVGGGTAGWMSAAACAKVLGPDYSIRLIESEVIGTVGVGEGTVPYIRSFNSMLQIDEADFVRNTQGSFKLGVQFRDWRRIGDTYIHGFGSEIGRALGSLPFHQYWLKAARMGVANKDIGAYVLSSLAASQDRFMVSASDVPPESPLANIAYAYHFDAGLYARYLRGYSEVRGVRRTEGRISKIEVDPGSGFVQVVVMEDGESIHGDLFIDCSGFRGLLIEETLETGYIDYGDWLPCDRAWAVPSANVGPLQPYTRATAREAGWQWRIPLQHRTGNGYVYSSRHVSDDEAAATLLKHLDGPALDEPRQLRFATGRRRKFWNRNVVAIGLSGGFMEPLEATGIYLIQSGIAKLLGLLPREGMPEALANRYNLQMGFDFDRIRDFLILHYHATERDDSRFWQQCANMDIPEELKDVIRLFRDSGRFYRNGEEMFAEMSWIQIMLGQGIVPGDYHPLVDRLPAEELAKYMTSVGNTIENCVAAMPPLQAFIDRHCKAPAAAM
ncbi:tryptophan halogenase [Pseudoxanthomonas kalamensis DSM 18571]|uniref:tryptophan halogenase family protein n=1 Tax=Pseudoxanthomonas kalamensis TaxID=289483 RepID=UPI00139116C7|nr:tryptophan halogenase family protein [Pseudoxanthomonas kalamensis]KAF1710521.1 tryptophan halogenase [Pseudoxanthomonas kalamensis DSM 18571]